MAADAVAASSPTDPRTALTRVDLTLMGVLPECNGEMGAAATTPCADLSITEKRLARAPSFRSATAAHRPTVGLRVLEHGLHDGRYEKPQSVRQAGIR